MNAKRLLVIKIRGLGDTLLATPALHALRQAWPQSHITALVSPAGREVLKNNPHVDDVLVYDKRRAGLGYALGFMRDLAQGRFDLAIALHASLRTALLARASRAPVRVVHNHSGANYFSTLAIGAKKEAKSSIQRDLDAIRALGLGDAGEKTIFVLSEDDFSAPKSFLQAQGLSGERGFFVFAPGSSDPMRRWHSAAGSAFLEHAFLLGMRDWVMLSGADDRELTSAIQAQTSFHPPVFCGTLQEAGALLKLSQGMVTVNSGPKHIAVALDVPTLTLWTNEPEAEWHPYNRSQHRLLRSASGVLADISPRAAAEAAQAHFIKRRGDSFSSGHK